MSSRPTLLLSTNRDLNCPPTPSAVRSEAFCLALETRRDDRSKQCTVPSEHNPPITAEQQVESSPKVDAMLHRVPGTASQSESNKHTERWTRFSYDFTDLLSPYTARYVRTGCRILESFRRASPTTPASRRAWIRTSVRRSSVSRMTSTIWRWR